MKFKNLYFNLACHDYKVETYVRNAEMIRDEILNDFALSDKEAKVLPYQRPERFQMWSN